MGSDVYFRIMFKDAALEVEDLFLLETFQIGYLPGWIPDREFAAVLWAHPALKRYLIKRRPAITDFIERIQAEFPPEADPEKLAEHEDLVAWTIADLLVYQKCPEVYDDQDFHAWDFDEVTSITSLNDKIIIDGGAGTGRVALKAAQTARHVFAVEPVSRLRQFIREKAVDAGLDNVFALDGTLDAIPLPDHFAGVLITSHALGWNLEEELREFERVVKPGGFVIHCPGTADHPNDETHDRLTSPDWGYAWSRFEEADGWKRKYWKQL